MAGNKRRTRNASATTLAKITRPQLSDVYARTRLFRSLDKARKRPIVWLTAPAGSGKTTLIASYLRSREVSSLWYQIDAGDIDVASFFYYMRLAAKSGLRKPCKLPLLTADYRVALNLFTTKYFRELFGCLRRPSVVVLDNYQEVSAEGALHELVQLGFEQIPPGVNVIVISREAPPSVFARSRVCMRMSILQWEELRLTEQESAGILNLRRKKSLFTRTMISRLHESTQGWAAGLVLVAEGAEHGLSEIAAPVVRSDESIYDYFASEIFRRADAVTQVFLLRTAFLPTIAAAVAQEFTGQSNAQKLLDTLTQRNFFTVKRDDGCYQYHPLFRAFLLARMSSVYTEVHINELKQQSARLLAKGGDIEAAVALLQQAQDWPSALKLVVDHADELMKQGRTQTVERWLTNIPELFCCGEPWFFYWRGSCRLEREPSEARLDFERAFALFEKHADATPLYMTWMRIIESIRLDRHSVTAMNKWLDAYKSLGGARTAPHPAVETASVFTYLLGLVHVRYDDPDMVIYAERAERLFQNEKDEGHLLAQMTALNSYYLFAGEYPKVRRLTEQLATYANAPGARPIVQLRWHIASTLYPAATGDYDESMRALKRGLEFAESSGVHVMDVYLLGYAIWGQLCAGNVRTARELLRQISSLRQGGPLSEMFYRHLSSLVLLHEGNLTEAIEQGCRVAEIAKANGQFVEEVHYLVSLAYLYAHQGDCDSATKAIAEVRSKLPHMLNKCFAYYVIFCEADIYRLRGDKQRALSSLREALKIGREMTGMMPAYCTRLTAATLYAMALEHDIESDYVRTVIAKARLSLPANFFSEHWPWEIRIRAFGRFEVLKHGKPLVFSSRAQKKPLELLRVLIAFGGKSVDVDKITEILWPESDGDVVKTTFRSVLHRTRKLVGDNVLVLDAGRLSLNSDCCWLDVWALEQLLEEKTLHASIGGAHKLLELYRGSFLIDDEFAWASIVRERWRSKFVRAVSNLYSDSFECEKTAWYERALEAEPLAEELYLSLMQHHASMSRIVEAWAVYERCRKTISAALHREPNAEITALSRRIFLLTPKIQSMDTRAVRGIGSFPVSRPIVD